MTVEKLDYDMTDYENCLASECSDALNKDTTDENSKKQLQEFHGCQSGKDSCKLCFDIFSSESLSGN